MTIPVPTQDSPRAFTLGPTQPSVGATVIRMFLAALIGGGAGLAGWFLFEHTNFPSFNTSYVLMALRTATIALLVVATIGIFWMQSRRAGSRVWGVVATVWAYLAPAGLVAASLTLPMSATKLYLHGISGDQSFRTEFLTRMTENPGWNDMAYAGLPSFYPAGWFLPGGLFARLMGLPGWEAYKPWAIVSLSAAATVLIPIWHRLTGSLGRSVLFTLVSTRVMLEYCADEPYAAVIALAVVPALIVAWRGVRGSVPGLVFTALFLGFSAMSYTLFTGVNALIVVAFGVAWAYKTRSWAPILRVVAVGVSSLALASIIWGPYLLQLATQPHDLPSIAQRYLPEAGTAFYAPFTQFKISGLVSIVGVVWLVLCRRQREAQAIWAGLAGYYGWSWLSMLVTVKGTTLLGFRLESCINELLLLAGVFGLFEAWKRAPEWGQWARQAVPVAMTLLSVYAVLGATFLSDPVMDYINNSYSDTDGYGQRSDRLSAGEAKYYGEIVEFIDEQGFTNKGETQVLTDQQPFLAYFPYLGWQAMTPHYANPLGQFSERNEEIRRWSEITDPTQMRQTMEQGQWGMPDVIIFRGKVTASRWSLTLVDDIYPAYDNIRATKVNFVAGAFEGWALKQVGPFVVAVRPAS